MDKQLHIVVKMDILPECLEKLQALIPRFNELVQRGEPDTMVYRWHINAKTMKCYLVETIRSDEALIVHLQNIGPILPDLFAVAPIVVWEIYGKLSEQVAETVAATAASNNIFLVRGEYVSGFIRELVTSNV